MDLPALATCKSPGGAATAHAVDKASIGARLADRRLPRSAVYYRAGLVTSLASGSAIASISGHHTSTSAASVNVLEREGGMQPLITEAWSEDAERRAKAMEALANLAGKRDQQDALFLAGVLRVLAQMASAPLQGLQGLQGVPSAGGAGEELARRIGFDTARAVSNLTDKAALRREIAQDDSAPVLVRALTRLGWDALKAGTSRVVLQVLAAVSMVEAISMVELNETKLTILDPTKLNPRRSGARWAVLARSSC